MEMTWEDLTKLFVWATKKGSDAPLADAIILSLMVQSRGRILSVLWSQNPDLPQLDIVQGRHSPET